MAVLEIVKYSDPRLREVSRAVENPADVADLVRDMTDSMYASRGAGLSAIQIGVPLRVFIVEPEIAGFDPKSPPLVFINPEIIELGADKETIEEGCLSFPGIFVPIERSLSCKARAFDLKGNSFEVEGEELFARAIQHENDHLNGRLLADFVGRIKRKLIERRLQREAGATD